MTKSTLDGILITGCTAGSLGSGTALAFHARGLHVFATARSPTHLTHLSSLPNVTTLSLDVTSPSSISAAVKTVKETPNVQLKYLINNAGMGMVMPLLDADIEAAKKVFDVNLWGVLAMTQAFAPMIVKAKGTVINIGSGAGAIHFPWSGIYGASKASLNHMSETLRYELEPLHVRVLTVYAGIISSNFHSSSSMGDTFSLPSTSYYKSLTKVMDGIARGNQRPGKIMSAENFGKEVCRDVVGGRSGASFTGTLGWAVKYVGLYPQWYLVSAPLVPTAGLEARTCRC
ncbi:putative estradiol 17 beta-dehydrogenase [Halenospora varia]|nr:putative estradiol 17 beta-dehydrogenase [Halenospora varia]